MQASFLQLDVPWTYLGRTLDVPWTYLGRTLDVPSHYFVFTKRMFCVIIVLYEVMAVRFKLLIFQHSTYQGKKGFAIRKK